MRSRILLFLASTALVTMAPWHAHAAAPLAAGCDGVNRPPVNGPAEVDGETTTWSFFVGSNDTTGFSVVCWLQETPNLSTSGEFDIPGTRHQCAGTGSVGLCPAFYSYQSNGVPYLCTWVSWSDAAGSHEYVVDADAAPGVQCRSRALPPLAS